MTQDLLSALETGPVRRFAEWPDPSVPKVAAGVYTIWDAEHFVAIRTAEAHEAADKARQRGEPCSHAVEVITEAQYRKERQ